MEMRRMCGSGVLFFALFVSCICMAQTTLASTPKVTNESIDDFLRQPDFSQVAISPNGSYISMLMPLPDDPYENNLAILDAKTAKVVRLIRGGHHVLIAKYFWVSDTRLVASIATRRGSLDKPALTGELFAINADGSGQINLFGARASNASTRLESWNDLAYPISTQPINDDEILIAAQAFTADPAGSLTSAKILNVVNGTVRAPANFNEQSSTLLPRPASSGNTPDFSQGWKDFSQNWKGAQRQVHDESTFPIRNATLVADHTGTVRAAYAKNMLWVRETDGSPWKKVNDPGKTGEVIEPIGFNRDNSGIYARVALGKSPESIELYNISTRQLSKVFQGRFADPGELLPTADGKDYYAVITQDGERALFYLDANSPEAQLNMALAANFPDQLAYFSSFTRDGKHAIVTVVSDHNPGDYYLFDFGTHEARYLMSAMPWIDPKQMLPMRPIEVRARDGLTLHGFLTLPVGNQPYPLIVLPHGGPIHVSDTWKFDSEVQLFASRGYAVLQLNYRGSGGYGAWFQHLGYRQWGLSMQDDLTDATQWAITRGYADPRRICIYGASYGAYAALEGVVREPDLYKCAIGYDGTYDLRVQLSDSDTTKTNAGEAYLAAALGSDPDDLLRRSPLGGVDRIKADVLLLHGEDDERTPYKNFQEFTKALDKNDKHYEKLVESHEGHGFFLPKHLHEAYQKMLDFLDRNIGAASITGQQVTATTPNIQAGASRAQ